MSDNEELDGIHTSMLSEIPNTYQKTQGFPTWDILRAFARGVHIVWTKALGIQASLDVDNNTGTELDRYITQRKGIYRREATQAVGTVVITVGAGTVAVGDQFATEGGIIFECTQETVVDSVPCSVPVRAVEAGASGCVPSGTIIKMPVTIKGIAEFSNPEPTVDGYDQEDDDTYRERYKLALREPATSGNAYHYKHWALSVPGVGGVRVHPLAKGDDTVGVVIIDADHKAASEELVKRVQDYIDPDSLGRGEGEAPVGAHCYVSAARAVKVNVSVKLSLTGTKPQNEVEDGIKAALTAYLYGIAFDRDYVSYAKVGDAILDCEGVEDYEALTLNGKADRVSLLVDDVPELGEVTINVVP